jgi:hypothetical protein
MYDYFTLSVLFVPVVEVGDWGLDIGDWGLDILSG